MKALPPLTAFEVFCCEQSRRLRFALISATPTQRQPMPPTPAKRVRPVKVRGPYQRRGEAAHGTVNRYNHSGCRCQLCKDAKMAYYHAYLAGPQKVEAGA